MSDLLDQIDYKVKYERACDELRRISRKQASLKREIKRLHSATQDERHKQLRNAAQHYKQALSLIAFGPKADDPKAIASKALKRKWEDALGPDEPPTPPWETRPMKDF